MGVIAVWKRKKNEQYTKQEDIYYSTIDETTMKRSPTSKPEPVYSEMNDQGSKEPHLGLHIELYAWASLKVFVLPNKQANSSHIIIQLILN